MGEPMGDNLSRECPKEGRRQALVAALSASQGLHGRFWSAGRCLVPRLSQKMKLS